MAIAALILGIISLNFGFVFWAWPAALTGIILGILALVFGIIAKNDPSHPNMATAGRRLGIAGIIAGSVAFVISIAVSNAVSNLWEELSDTFLESMII
ncbi:MAG: hypothetical protein LBQ44_02845 [Treponema sp.]|jgi:CBS-domain-containing membrane protein|nr:hypothetical protein [Treponema sp.]